MLRFETDPKGLWFTFKFDLRDMARTVVPQKDDYGSNDKMITVDLTVD